MRCYINIGRVQEGQAVSGSVHVISVLLQGLLVREGIVTLEGLIELRFALVL